MTAPKMASRRAKAKVLFVKTAFHKRTKRVAVKLFFHEQRQRRGEAVQIIFFADRADLAVAVKSGEADRSQFLLHQFSIVVGHAEKIFSATIAAAEAAAVNRRTADFLLRVFEQIAHVLVRRRRVAPVELHGLTRARQRGDRQHAGIRVAADEIAHEKVAAMKIGDGTEQGVTQGPLINMDAVDKVEKHIADAVKGGARIVTGGKRHSLGGTFFEPTVLADVKPDMAVAREETFGPVAPLFRFKNEGEAVHMANDTEFGLASYFYGRDIGRIWRVAEALDYGMVGINTGIISTEVAPFDGVKESGLNHKSSKYGLDEYLEIKYLCMGGI